MTQTLLESKQFDTDSTVFVLMATMNFGDMHTNTQRKLARCTSHAHFDAKSLHHTSTLQLTSVATQIDTPRLRNRPRPLNFDAEMKKYPQNSKID